MTTFAQYPELPDEDKNSQQQGQEIGASASTGGTPPSAGTPSAKPQGTPTNSGLAQNFSAFQNANKSKLDALKNLTVDRVQSGVNNATQAVQKDAAAEADKIGGKQVGYDWNGVDANSSAEVYNQAAQALAAAREKADANPSVANVTSGQSAQDLKTATEVAGNLNSKAGTTNALIKGGTNAANATQDSLLLQANADYRKAAQAAADQHRGTFQNTLDTARTSLTNKADQVNTANAGLVQAGMGKLGAVREGIDKDIEKRALDASDTAKLAALQRTSDAEKAFWADIQKQAGNSNYALEKGYISQANTDTRDKVITQLSSQMGSKHPAEILQSLGIKSEELGRLLAQPDATVSTDQIVAKDPALQARLAALNAIVGGRNYNTSAQDNFQEDRSGALQALQERILQAIYGKATKEIDDRIAAMPKKPNAPGAGSGSRPTILQ